MFFSFFKNFYAKIQENWTTYERVSDVWQREFTSRPDWGRMEVKLLRTIYSPNIKYTYSYISDELYLHVRGNEDNYYHNASISISSLYRKLYSNDFTFILEQENDFVNSENAKVFDLIKSEIISRLKSTYLLYMSEYLL